MTKEERYIICFKKVLYKTLIDAELEAAVLFLDKGRNIRPYKCDVCPFWHLTNQPWSEDWIRHCHKIDKRLHARLG